MTSHEPLIDLAESQEVQNKTNVDETNDEEDDGQQVTFYQGVVNVFNQVEGLGLLGIPFTFRLGGLSTALILTLVCAASCSTGCLLSRCLYDPHGNRVRGSYGEIALAAGGVRAHVIVKMFMISSLLGVITVYIILIAASLDPVAKLVHHGFSLSKGYSTILATGACFPLVHFKHISGIVTYFNMVGVLALVATFFAVVIASSHVIVTQDNHDSSSGSDNEHIAWWDTNMKDLPITLGILIFSFSAHGTFPGQSCNVANT